MISWDLSYGEINCQGWLIVIIIIIIFIVIHKTDVTSLNSEQGYVIKSNFDIIQAMSICIITVITSTCNTQIHSISTIVSVLCCRQYDVFDC